MVSLINSNESLREEGWGRDRERESEGKPLFVFLLQCLQQSFKVKKKEDCWQ